MDINGEIHTHNIQRNTIFTTENVETFNICYFLRSKKKTIDKHSHHQRQQQTNDQQKMVHYVVKQWASGKTNETAVYTPHLQLLFPSSLSPSHSLSLSFSLTLSVIVSHSLSLWPLNRPTKSFRLRFFHHHFHPSKCSISQNIVACTALNNKRLVH